MPDLTRQEIEEALTLSNKYVRLGSPEAVHWDRCGEAANHEIACDHCKDIAALLDLLPRALRQLLAATEDSERLDSGRICLRITDDMQHEWTYIDLRSAIDAARGRK